MSAAASAMPEAADAAPGGTQPLLSNTGVERTGLAWGWLAGTVRADRDQVARYFKRTFGVEVERGYGGKWYASSAEYGADGVVVFADPRGAGAESEARKDECSFVIPQSACDRLGWLAVANVAAVLVDMGAHFTRADCSFDDQERRAHPREVLEAFRSGQRHTRVTSSSVRDKWKGAECVGYTAYLGSPQAERMLRVYDKDQERGEAEGTYGVRYELQARNGAAGELVARVLLNLESENTAGEQFAAELVGHVDFVDRGLGKAHGERFPRLEWWAGIVGSVRKVQVRGRQVLDSLESRKRWFERQCEPTLALLLLEAGGDVEAVLERCRRGLRRLGAAQIALLPEGVRVAWQT